LAKMIRLGSTPSSRTLSISPCWQASCWNNRKFWHGTLDKWVPCHHSMAHPKAADGEWHHIWRVLQIYWIKSHTQPTKGGPPTWEFDGGAKQTGNHMKLAW
jgi:hypothetical protein